MIVIQFGSGTGMNAEERLHIGKAIYDSIIIEKESSEVCATPFPCVADLLHEHFTLVESGSYTTQRDADFIGQSIHELMKKQGNTRKAAYKKLQIENDPYDLDQTAVKMAKVFRLNRELFDPYTEEFLEAVRPVYAIVSCRKDNAYGHPKEEVIERLNSLGVCVLRTDSIGNISFYSNGSNIVYKIGRR